MLFNHIKRTIRSRRLLVLAVCMTLVSSYILFRELQYVRWPLGRMALWVPKPTLSIAYHFQDWTSRDVQKSKFFTIVVPALCQNSSGPFDYNVIVGFRKSNSVDPDYNQTRGAFYKECAKFKPISRQGVVINFEIKEILGQGEEGKNTESDEITKAINSMLLKEGSNTESAKLMKALISMLLQERTNAKSAEITKAINSMLFQEAYMKDHDYYFHLNSEIKLKENWDLEAVSTLKESQPRGTGVVILSDDRTVGGVMVHRTHFDLYNQLYPLGSTDFKVAMSWMASVYGVLDLIRGFFPRHVNFTERQKVKVEVDRRYLQRYLKVVALGLPPPSGKRVVAMSLYGDSPRYTIGIIRNAQLIRVNFPGWVLRVYLEKPDGDGATVERKVPREIIMKLESLGAQMVYVDLNQFTVPGRMWRFFAMDDLKADYVISRDCDSRLTRRDAVFTHEWIKSGKPVHCIRDNIHHKWVPIQAGMMGAKPRETRRILKSSLTALMKDYTIDYWEVDAKFLIENIWKKVPKSEIYYHDSVTCKQMAAHPVPMNSNLNDFVGAIYYPWKEERIGDNPPVTSAKECIENKYEDDGPLLV